MFRCFLLILTLTVLVGCQSEDKRFGLSEAQRYDVLQELDRADRWAWEEAEEKFPWPQDAATLQRLSALAENLSVAKRATVREQYGLSTENVDTIYVEALEKGWLLKGSKRPQ